MGIDVVVPIAGRDYPATWQAFEAWFVDEDTCRTYLEGLRWPEGFICPSCDASDAWRTGSGLWMCGSCGRQTSVTAGTIFHRTRTPLKTWFAAIWFVCGQKNGTSAKALQQMLGFGSYETAWAMMHKLRRAMVSPNQSQLGGPGVSVELDETVVGGRSKGRGGPSYDNKGRVVIAVERRDPKGLGRVRMRHISSHVKDEVLDFASDVIAPATIVWTDGARHYMKLTNRLDVTHEPIQLVHADEAAHVLLPAVHRVASLLKRWLTGTLHYGQSFEHLDYYLDEFTFRFNRRTSRSRGLLFYRLTQNALVTQPHPLNTLTTTKSSDLS